MSELNVNSGETLSFYQLFAEKQLKVEIPIIQRDYAQGRKSEREVRTNFLDALYMYLDENRPNRDLDFVYGSTQDGTFIPLDGQQRLTTLFLLHWYLTQLSGNINTFRSVLAKDGKSLFSYKTRSSSKEFCNALMSEPFDYSGHSDISIAKKITNEGWFYRSWKFDPTVSAMLEMLSAIEEKFKDRPYFFYRLTDIAKPIITFQFLDLEEFHLTDDLYIKMNSRGKPLSPFENFKAKFEQHISKLFKDDSQAYELKMNGETVKMSPSEYFFMQIDTKWLNHFWSKSEHDPQRVDDYLMNFIRVILANNVTVLNKIIPLESLRVLFQNWDTLSFFRLNELGAITKETIGKLISSFDQVMRVNMITPEYLPHSFHYNTDNSFKQAVELDLSAQDRLRLHAFLGFLIQNEEDLDGLNEWMRVIYNLTENSRLESTDEIARGLKEIEVMLPYAPNILNALANSEFKVGVFYGRQIEEERIKACLILKTAEWSDLIKKIEKHPFFRGQVGFILEFSDILDYYLENSNCNWDTESGNEFLKKFSDYSEKSKCVFNKLLARENENYLWERAVLTKGNYLIPTTYNRFHFLTTGLLDRDFSWKRLLRIDRKDDDSLKSRRLFVKAVFDDERFDSTDFEGSCKAIIQDGADDWRAFFIKKPELIRQCIRGFMRFEDELTIDLLETTRLTYHRELRTYSLYLEHIKANNFAPFENTQYIKEYGYEGHSHIFIGNWVHSRKEYQLKIFFDRKNHYGIEFSKVRGGNKVVDYTDQLQSICNELNFQFDNQKWNGYFKTSEIEAEVVKAIMELTEKLRQLL